MASIAILILLLRIFSKFDTRIAEWSFIFVMIIVASIRNIRVGADTYNYVFFFKGIGNIFNFDVDYHPELEIGFKVYLSLMNTITDSQFVFLFVSTAICIIPMYIGMQRLNLKYCFAGLVLYFFIFYFNYPINVLRQGISMSLLIFSLPYFVKQEYIKIILLGSVAGLIHSTGFLIIVFYLFYVLDYKKSVILTIILTLFLVVSYKFNILQYLLFTYVDSSKEDSFTEKFSSSTGITQYLYRLLIVGILFYFVNRTKDLNLKKLFLIYILGFFVYISLSENNLLAARFNMFFRILEVVIFPMLFGFCKNVQERFLLFLIFLGLYLPFYYITVTMPVNLYSISDEFR